MDVIILGGGLMGTSSAFFLAQRGLRVCLIERGHIGAGATVASFGNIRRSGRYLPQLPLAHRSLALWHQAEQMLGQDVEFRATGHVRLIFDDGGLAAMRDYQTAARPWGLDIDELTKAELHRKFPGLGPDAIGASFSTNDGSGNPRLISPAFARAAQRLGAVVHDNTQVLRVSKTAAGFAVDTSGGRIEGARLLNCTGAWGADLAAQFDEPVPLGTFGPQMGVTEPLPYRITPVVGMWGDGPGAYFRQVERGNIVFGGGVDRVPVDRFPGHAKVDMARLPAQMARLCKLLPALRGALVIRQWSGCEGYVQDGLPVMGASSTTDGLFHAFGFCGHGFQLGPGVGDVMAELIATGASTTPIAEFDIARFQPSP